MIKDDLNFVEEYYSDEGQLGIFNWLDIIFPTFKESDPFKQLTTYQKENAFFLIRRFLDFSYSYFLKGIAKLNENEVREICLEIFPRKVSCEKECFESFAPIMTAFLTWCGEQNYISNAKEFCAWILFLSDEMVQRSQDSRYWGMAKSLFSDTSFDFSPDVKKLEKVISNFNASKNPKVTDLSTERKTRKKSARKKKKKPKTYGKNKKRK